MLCNLEVENNETFKYLLLDCIFETSEPINLKYLCIERVTSNFVKSLSVGKL